MRFASGISRRAVASSAFFAALALPVSFALLAPGAVAQSGGGGTMGAIKLLWPVHGPVLTPFSDDKLSPHHGIVISAQPEAPVACARDGKVILVDELEGYGKILMVEHGKGLVTVYANLGKILVKEGRLVRGAQHIATAGLPAEGGAQGLLFQVRYRNLPVDPVLVLPAGYGDVSYPDEEEPQPEEPEEN